MLYYQDERAAWLVHTKTSQPPDGTLIAQQAAVRSTKLEVKHGPAWIKYLIIGVLIPDQFPSEDGVKSVSLSGSGDSLKSGTDTQTVVNLDPNSASPQNT